jgi:acyl carrier protein
MDHEPCTHEVAKAVRAVVLRHLPAGLTEADFSSDMPLARLGLDSVASINLLLDLESSLGIIAPDDWLTPDVLRTLGGIERLVTRLLASPVAHEGGSPR